MAPDVANASLENKMPLILATDGFWAMPDAGDQVRFLSGECKPSSYEYQDDCSTLTIQANQCAEAFTFVGPPQENLYLRTSQS